MKGCRKCHTELKVSDSLIYMKDVNKGTQKIMTTIPDQLTRLFMWTVLTIVFVFFLVIATYLMLWFELSSKSMLSSEKTVISIPSALHAQEPPMVLNATTRGFCSTVSRDLYSPKQIGHVDTDHRISKLLSLNISASDVHFVFTNTTHVPWLSTCSLESVLRSIGNKGRVNVFVVSGIEFERPQFNGQNKILPVSLTSSLIALTFKYGSDRLNVVNINLKECLECSPFQGMNLSKRPEMASHVVQLILLWQFGGTVLDSSVVAVHGEVYRASDKAVVYDDRTVSSPVPCHAFIYDMMLCAKNVTPRTWTLIPNTVRKIMERTIQCTERITGNRSKEAQPVANSMPVMCRGGGRCYYEVTDCVSAYKSDSYLHSFCPVVSQSVFSWS